MLVFQHSILHKNGFGFTWRNQQIQGSGKMGWRGGNQGNYIANKPLVSLQLVNSLTKFFALAGRDIFSVSRVLVPINTDEHWTLGVFYMEEKRLTIYDSLGGHDEVAINNLWDFLNNEYVSNTNQKMPGDWVYERDKRTPQQLNGLDCGVFICLFADFLSLNLPLIFQGERIPNIRMRFAKLAIEEHANFSDHKNDSPNIERAWKTILISDATN